MATQHEFRSPVSKSAEPDVAHVAFQYCCIDPFKH